MRVAFLYRDLGSTFYFTIERQCGKYGVDCIFPALKGEESMESEGKVKKRIVIAEDYRILREGLRPLQKNTSLRPFG
jgi:hypothetical protein